MSDFDQFDSLLDASLDDLADLPEFKPFTPGVHEVTIEFKTKVINKHPAVELNMTMVKTIEQVDPAAPMSEPGATTSVAYMLDNDTGQGKLKEICADIGRHLGIDVQQKGALRQIIEKSTGLVCKVVTNTRPDKEDKDKVYMNVKSLTVA